MTGRDIAKQQAQKYMKQAQIHTASPPGFNNAFIHSVEAPVEEVLKPGDGTYEKVFKMILGILLLGDVREG